MRMDCIFSLVPKNEFVGRKCAPLMSCIQLCKTARTLLIKDYGNSLTNIAIARVIMGCVKKG